MSLKNGIQRIISAGLIVSSLALESLVVTGCGSSYILVDQPAEIAQATRQTELETAAFQIDRVGYISNRTYSMPRNNFYEDMESLGYSIHQGIDGETYVTVKPIEMLPEDVQKNINTYNTFFEGFMGYITSDGFDLKKAVSCEPESQSECIYVKGSFISAASDYLDSQVDTSDTRIDANMPLVFDAEAQHWLYANGYAPSQVMHAK